MKKIIGPFRNVRKSSKLGRISHCSVKYATVWTCYSARARASFITSSLNQRLQCQVHKPRGPLHRMAHPELLLLVHCAADDAKELQATRKSSRRRSQRSQSS